MGPTISQISKEFNLSPDELTKRSLLSYLEHELRLAEEDIADIRDKYLVATKAELEKKSRIKIFPATLYGKTLLHGKT